MRSSSFYSDLLCVSHFTGTVTAHQPKTGFITHCTQGSEAPVDAYFSRGYTKSKGQGGARSELPWRDSTACVPSIPVCDQRRGFLTSGFGNSE